MSSVEKMPPLTAEEQKMAEDYYHLVDEFLRRKRLDPNEYFDVVIFGYLQAIQRECRNPSPPEKRNFHGLVEVCMKRAVFQDWRYKGREMREADRLALSLDGIPAGTDNEDFSLYEIVADVRQNILQMARGAIMERADYEMSRLLANILDPNTSATAKRKLTLTLEMKPDDDRQTITVSCTAKPTLAATNPVVTTLYVADEDNVVEMVPQIPGQTGLDGGVQEAPPVLKVIKFA